MYNTSEAYKNIIYNRGTRETKLTGTLKLKSGKVIQLADDDVKLGSLCVDYKPIGNMPFAIGETYVGGLSVAIKSLTKNYVIDYEDTDDGEVDFTFHLKLDDGTYESVPIGVFSVDSATRSGEYLKIKGYDHMLKFDKKINLPENDYKLMTPRDIVDWACKECGVEPDGNVLQWIQDMTPYLKEKVTQEKHYAHFQIGQTQTVHYVTFRDLLHAVGSFLCSFFYISRTGKLRLDRSSYFGPAMPGEPVYHPVILNKVIKHAEVNNSYTICKQIEFNLGNQSGFTYDKRVTEAKRKAHSYYLGQIPFVLRFTGLSDEWNYPTIDDYMKIAQVILDHTMWDNPHNPESPNPEYLYRAQSVNFLGDPAIELGDRYYIEQNGSKYFSPVLSIKYRYHGDQTLSSFGLDKDASRVLLNIDNKADSDSAVNVNKKVDKSVYVEVDDVIKSPMGPDPNRMPIANFTIKSDESSGYTYYDGRITFYAAKKGLYKINYTLNGAGPYGFNLFITATQDGQWLQIPINYRIYMGKNQSIDVAFFIVYGSGKERVPDGCMIYPQSNMRITGKNIIEEAFVPGILPMAADINEEGV